MLTLFFQEQCKCGLKIEKRLMQTHQVSLATLRLSLRFVLRLLRPIVFIAFIPVTCLQSLECSQRLVPCQFCDLELAFCQAREHEEYCGTRTEPCPVCKCNIMLREKVIHPALCGNLTPPQERRTNAQGPAAWFETQPIHNLLRAQERSNNNTGLIERRGPPRPLESRLHNSTRVGTWRNEAPRNNEFVRCRSN